MTLALLLGAVGCAPEPKLNSARNDPKDGLPSASGMKMGTAGKIAPDAATDKKPDAATDKKPDAAPDKKPDAAPDKKANDAPAKKPDAPVEKK
jgi:hypothetical protein